MRPQLIFAVLAAVVLAACVSTQEPEDWSMSPDSFGPIHVTTTEAEALETGAFKTSPSPCSEAVLDWHTQEYKRTKADEDQDGKADHDVLHAGLPTLYLRGDKPGFEFIDPGARTKTDRGIRRGDSFKAFEAAYGDDWIAQSGSTPASGAYAVNGKHSHLLFSVADAKVASFFIARGTVKNQDDFLVGRGGLC